MIFFLLFTFKSLKTLNPLLFYLRVLHGTFSISICLSLSANTLLFSLSVVWQFETQWTAARQVSLSFTIPGSLLKLIVHRVGDAIQTSHPLSCPSPPALYLSQHQGLFQWVDSSYQVVKVGNLSFSFSPSNEYEYIFTY